MYYNYYKDITYGTLKYGISLRNWNCLGYTKQQNLDKGPVFILELTDFKVITWGDSIDKCLQSLKLYLDFYAEKSLPLPK